MPGVNRFHTLNRQNPLARLFGIQNQVVPLVDTP